MRFQYLLLRRETWAGVAGHASRFLFSGACRLAPHRNSGGVRADGDALICFTRLPLLGYNRIVTYHRYWLA
jgi:hypothetical protein